MPVSLLASRLCRRFHTLAFLSVVFLPGATFAQASNVVHMTKRNAPGFAIDGNHGAENLQDVYLWKQSANSVNQQWIELDRGNGFFAYQKVNTDHCLDGGRGGAAQQNVYLWRCRIGNQNQEWRKVNVGNGSFRLEKRNAPAFSLDGRSGGSNRQSLRLMPSDNSNQNQHWSFRVLRGVESATPETVPVVTPVAIPIPANDPGPATTLNQGGDAVETDTEAANFLMQATFGPTEDSIANLRRLGYSDWFRAQLNIRIAPYINDAVAAEREVSSSQERGAFATEHWMRKAVNGEDQLRQRTVFALSEIFATGMASSSRTIRKSQLHATYQDIFQTNAFGNYRDLLQDVTYSPMMGSWLTYVGNEKANAATGAMPDENYAREIMQLFTIGLLELDIDGSVRTTRGGVPIETYDQDDVEGLAKVFTGLNWAGLRRGRTESLHTRLPQDILPMEMDNAFHSDGRKTFLGETVPDFNDGNRTITAALDILFNHSNVAPFISRQLIQRFTTGNPRSAYIARVARVFNSGRFTLPDGSQVGNGQRGHLAPVIAAILFDSHARTDERFESTGFARTWGKLREPMIRFVHWMRVAEVRNRNIETGRIGPFDTNWQFGQRPFNAPSVFNFFRPGFVAPNTRTGDNGLTQPELQIASGTNLINYFNRMRDYVLRDSNDDFGPGNNYSRERGLANRDSADRLTNYLNLVYTANQMSDETWQHIHDAIEAIDLPSNSRSRDEALLQRARVGTLLAVTAIENSKQR